MDINVLAVNVGNTRIAVGAFAAGELLHVVRLEHAQRDQWPQLFREIWQKLDRDDAAVVGSTVNPLLTEGLEHVIAEATNHTIQWIGQQIELPINVLTEEPDKTGVDRVLNVAAAYEQMGKAVVVVDAGTAVTVDCCNDNGDFLGGAIAPGAKLMLQSLHEHTAKLPEVTFAPPEGNVGTTTESAMRHGAFSAIRGLVKELAEQYATQLGNWPEIIATGGDATALFGDWELIHAISPDLTLYGIALAYAEHHIKHGT